MEKLKNKAFSFGATEFGKSKRKNKKYYIVYGGKIIHFGHSSYEDYTTHHDKERRDRYRKRASKIRDKSGKLTVNNKYSPNFWAYHILW